MLYVGQGARGGGDEILALSRHYCLPIVMPVMAKGIIPDSEENFMGMAARVATKPANEALAMSDLIIFVGSDFPFAKTFFPRTSRLIQVDVDSTKLGRRHFTDVGNTTIHAIRLLEMDGRGKRFTTSGLFTTMGVGVPGAIAAKLNFPNRQVFSLSGDGAFAMVMQDVITQVKYGLPIINVVFSNDSLGFIDAEQEDTGQAKFGADLAGTDYARIGEAMGARGFRVDRREQLPAVFDAASDSRQPVVIDVKIGNRRPFPAEAMALDPDRHSREDIEDFKRRYGVGDMPVLREMM